MTIRLIFYSLVLVCTIGYLSGCTADRAELCMQPQVMAADHITYNSARISWSRGKPSDSYELQYRVMDSLVWTVQMCSADSFTISGLKPSTPYQFRLKAHCGSLSSQISSFATFTTDSLVHSVYIPNSFSPNGDGVHDTLIISSPIIISADMTIYNRWGQTMYHSGPVASPSWDGKYLGNEQPQSTYYYSLTLVYIDGYIQHRQGFLQLLR